MSKLDDGTMASFQTGATRTSERGKLDYEGFLSPIALERYAQYMHKHRSTPDGGFRDSDNWQLGIPLEAYMKSGWRHFHDWHLQHRGWPGKDTLEESLCALIFNATGYLHEIVRKRLEHICFDSQEACQVNTPANGTTILETK